MESIDPLSIQFADYNPRLLTDQAGAQLDTSITTFGDISGLTSNRRSNRWVTGHQRLFVLNKRYPGRVKIYIQHKFDEPDEYGTTATGFVGVEGINLHLAWRQVDWDEGKEKAANVAANKIEAQWDNDLLAKLDYDLSQLENGDELLALSGQTEDEVTKLLKSVGAGPDDEPDEPKPDDQADSDKLTFALTRDQRLIVERAIEQIKRTRELQAISAPSLNGAALFVLASDYLDQHPEPQVPAGELTDIPA